MARKTSAKPVRKAAKSASKVTVVKGSKATRSAKRPASRRAKPVRTAKEILRSAPKVKQEVQADSERFQAPHIKMKDLFGDLEFKAQKGKKTKLAANQYSEFFQAEIDAELAREAEIVNDRTAHWRCQCCDIVLKVPRRTEVVHGDYHLVHDDKMGLLVNGEKFVPRAETPIEVQQPGRLRDPWTGETLGGPKVR